MSTDLGQTDASERQIGMTRRNFMVVCCDSILGNLNLRGTMKQQDNECLLNAFSFSLFSRLVSFALLFSLNSLSKPGQGTQLLTLQYFNKQ